MSWTDSDVMFALNSYNKRRKPGTTVSRHDLSICHRARLTTDRSLFQSRTFMMMWNVLPVSHWLQVWQGCSSRLPNAGQQVSTCCTQADIIASKEFTESVLKNDHTKGSRIWKSLMVYKYVGSLRKSLFRDRTGQWATVCTSSKVIISPTSEETFGLLLHSYKQGGSFRNCVS